MQATQVRKRKMTTEKVIGANIAARRGTLGLTQAKLGRAIGYDRRFIQRIEYGETSLDVGLLPLLAKELKLSDPLVLLKPDAFL